MPKGLTEVKTYTEQFSEFETLLQKAAEFEVLMDGLLNACRISFGMMTAKRL